LDVAASLASSLVAVVLLAAAGGKMGDRNGFRLALQTIGIPARLHNVVLVALVTFEIVLGLAVLIGVASQETRALLVGVMVVFFAVNVVGARTMSGLECRCFGQLSRTRFGRRAVARTAILLVLASAGLVGTFVHGTERPTEVESAFLLLAGLLFAVASSQAARAAQLVEEAMLRDAE
jgi:uncharacterized membrane protein YphA (DoxX/SURF4 family)